MQVMTAQGQTIVRAIMNGLAGDKPLYGLDLRRANPATVLWLIAKLSPEGLHALLIDALNHVPLEVTVFRSSLLYFDLTHNARYVFYNETLNII